MEKRKVVLEILSCMDCPLSDQILNTCGFKDGPTELDNDNVPDDCPLLNDEIK